MVGHKRENNKDERPLLAVVVYLIVGVFDAVRIAEILTEWCNSLRRYFFSVIVVRLKKYWSIFLGGSKSRLAAIVRTYTSSKVVCPHQQLRESACVNLSVRFF